MFYAAVWACAKKLFFGGFWYFSEVTSACVNDFMSTQKMVHGDICMTKLERFLCEIDINTWFARAQIEFLCIQVGSNDSQSFIFVRSSVTMPVTCLKFQ